MILPEGKQTMSGEDRRRAIAGRLGAEPVAASRLAEAGRGTAAPAPPAP